MFEPEIDMKKISSTLKLISENYAPDSEEFQALKLAKLAIQYVWDEQSRNKFRKWVGSMSEGLSDKQKTHLSSMGIDPETGESLW
ncbi:MAG: hypothetical protein WC701_09510 [Kiritimatiellales bacterium]|jgi:hypothetical protein